MDFSLVDSALRAAARERWPNCEVQSRLRPHFDLALGHACSDLSLRLGAALRRDPSGLAEELQRGLPDPYRGWSFIRAGYLNFTIPALSLDKIGAFSALLAGCKADVLLPEAVAELCGWSWLRLCCAGIMHFALLRALGADARLYLGAEELAPAALPTGDGGALFLRLHGLRMRSAEKGIAGSAYYNDELWQLADAAPERLKFLWTAPEAIAPRLVARASRGGERKLRLQGAERNWLVGIEERDLDARAAALVPAAWPALFLYLCGPVLASEIDPAVPSLGERGNLWWNLRATFDRLSGLLPAATAVSPVELHGLPPAASALCVRIALFAEYARSAALDGEIRSFLQILDEVLSLSNKLLNSPEVRRALSAGEQTLETNILAGARQTLSDIIGQELFGPHAK